MNHGGHEELEGHETWLGFFVIFAIFVYFVVTVCRDHQLD